MQQPWGNAAHREHGAPLVKRPETWGQQWMAEKRGKLPARYFRFLYCQRWHHDHLKIHFQCILYAVRQGCNSRDKVMPFDVTKTAGRPTDHILWSTVYFDSSSGSIRGFMDYQSLKHLHMAVAGLSGGFFLLRGAWMMAESPLLQRRWVRTVPHIVDTALLASAVALAVWSAQYPFAQSWLTAKVLALLAYIVLGTIALKRGRTKRIRGAAYVAAVLVFLYIAGVAVGKNPLFFTDAGQARTAGYWAQCLRDAGQWKA